MYKFNCIFFFRRHRIDRAQWPRKWNTGGKRWCRRQVAATVAAAIRVPCHQNPDAAKDRVVAEAVDLVSSNSNNRNWPTINSNCRRRHLWARGIRRKCAVSTSRKSSVRTVTSVSSLTVNKICALCSGTPSTRRNRAARSIRPVTALTVNGVISCTRATVTYNQLRLLRRRCPPHLRPASAAMVRWPTSASACLTACSLRRSRPRADYQCSTGCPALHRPLVTCSRSTCRPQPYRAASANQILVSTGSERPLPPPPPIGRCHIVLIFLYIPKRDNSLVHSLNYISR